MKPRKFTEGDFEDGVYKEKEPLPEYESITPSDRLFGEDLDEYVKTRSGEVVSYQLTPEELEKVKGTSAPKTIGEKASKEQIRYANKLMSDVFGGETLEDREYGQEEIVKITNWLLRKKTDIEIRRIYDGE